MSERRDMLVIRVSENTKHKFQALFYLLKAQGLIERQEELIDAIVQIYERYPALLKKILKREFI